MVLLENHNNALPLSKSTSSVAVVGPLADDALDQLGPDVPIGYDTNPSDFSSVDKIVTVRQGIHQRPPEQCDRQLRAGVRHGVHRHIGLRRRCRRRK